MKHTALFGGLSLLVAGAAVGAGAVASGNAMAGDDAPPADEGTVEVVTGWVDLNGEAGAFSCTFDGVDLDAVFSTAGTIDGLGTVDTAEGGGVVVGATGIVPADADGAFEVIEGSLPVGVVGDAVVIDEAVEIDAASATEVREGTPEECAEVLRGFTQTQAP